MKEKPICVEQGQKLAKEVMQPSQNLKINVNEAEVVIEAEIIVHLPYARHCA